MLRAQRSGYERRSKRNFVVDLPGSERHEARPSR
jgi:hypothetical protein